MHENWLAERGEQFRSGIQIATVDPFQGQKERLREAFTADEAHISVDQKPSTDIIELGRRIARGYRNTTSYQLRMLLIAGGLDASTHTQL